MCPLPTAARVVTRGEEIADALAPAARAERVAIDIEASGMFAYRARPCTVQIAWDDGAQIVIIDALAAPLAPLTELLGESGPVKIVHDVAFDARLLGESGIDLGNVHDTSISARMLGRTATGLATLLEAETGILISKTMQHHDWRVRPLDDAMLGYLTTDVFHLANLERKIWAEVQARGIEEAVLEETRHRIATAIAAVRHTRPSPPYARVKGAGRLPERELAALRVVAELREREAERRDVPPHNVASGDTLIAVASARPVSAEALVRIRGVATSTPEARAFVEELVRALRVTGDRIPEDERHFFEPVRMPAAAVKSRREREGRLLAWRRSEAQLRGVDEQVILPGHCVKDALDVDMANVDDLARVPGIGAFRVSRDGEAILSALKGSGTTP